MEIIKTGDEKNIRFRDYQFKIFFMTSNKNQILFVLAFNCLVTARGKTERYNEMLTTHTLRNLVIAGFLGEISFEIYAWLVSPILFGVALGPANLVIALIKIASGVTVPYWAGFLVHFTIGVIGFSGFVWLTHILARTSLILSGVIAGFILWFVAQGLLAPVVGRTFMMGFGPYTQSSFIGHVGMATLIGYVMVSLQRRQALNK